MSDTSQASVLFVDDDPGILATMRMLFRGRYKTHFANSGSEALQIVREQPVDVIVSDQRMPAMTGVELLRAVRGVNENIMRILLTGYSDLTSIVGSINDGEIFRFVNKPWDNEELLQCVALAVDAAKISASIEPLPEETLEAAKPAGHATRILVMDDDAGMAAKIQDILGPEFQVSGATTLAAAVDQLESDDVAVVISETRVQSTPVTSLLGKLKLHKPELVSVILTERTDAHSAIELINQGQIFRMISKPLHDSQARIAIKSAVRQHQRLSHAPQLTKRYEVAESREPVANKATEGLLDRIRGFRSRLRTSA